MSKMGTHFILKHREGKEMNEEKYIKLKVKIDSLQEELNDLVDIVQSLKDTIQVY